MRVRVRVGVACRVDDVLAVARDHGEAAVGVVHQALRVDLAHVELLVRVRVRVKGEG